MPSILGASLSFPQKRAGGNQAAHASTQSRIAQQKANHRGGGAVPARIFAVETWGPRFAPWRLLTLARTGHAVFTHPPGHSAAGCSVALLLRTFLGCLYAGSLVLAFAGRPPRRVCVACERMDPARLMSSVVGWWPNGGGSHRVSTHLFR